MREERKESKVEKREKRGERKEKGKRRVGFTCHLALAFNSHFNTI